MSDASIEPVARAMGGGATTRPMSRWQAAGIHLGISALIAALVMGVLFLIWYPSTYFTAMGGEQLVYLLVGCDVVLGPLITLVVFKAGKKGLRFDLAVIGFLQSAALTYGVLIAAEARPVYTAFVVDRFEVVAANDIEREELAKVTRPELKSLSWTGPRIVAALKPTDPNEQFRIVMMAPQGKDLQHFPQLYVPYAEVAAEAGRRAQPLSALRRFNPERTDEIDMFLRRHNLIEADVGFLPMRAKRALRAVMLNRSGEILGILDLMPWK